MSEGRVRVSSGSPFESIAGYSRAVRVGDSIFVSGTTATRNGEIVGIDDPAAQTRRILEIIATALQQLGSGLSDVTRLTIYVTDVSRWQEVAKELGKVFGDIRPANTLVGVNALVDPRMLVEISADAMVGSGTPMSDR